MSDYEMIAAVQGYLANGMTIMLNMFTVLGAYLVAGYLAAHRVSFLMTLFVTALFLAFAIICVVLMNSIGIALQALLDHMHATGVAGKGLSWSPIAKASSPPSVWVAGVVTLAIMVMAAIGAVYFFFECRRRNLKAETSSALQRPSASADERVPAN